MEDDLFAGRYRLTEKLGAGGMSEVWAADDIELDRRVALKLLALQAGTDRFSREARAVAALGHPNINQLYDYGDADGRPYMVLEWLSGGTLQDRLALGRPLSDDVTRAVATDIASGLAHAHSRGLVHRDLKPANVLFDSEERAKIADFGIARLGGDGTLTEAGTVIGTATTISPEQAAGEPATPASDVYSFGVLLFWMLTGRPPFLSESPMELLQLHRGTEPPSVQSLRADAPPELATLAAAALAKDPGARPADGATLLQYLTPASATATIPLAATAPRRRRGLPATFLAVLVLAALAVGGAAVAFLVVHNSDASSPLTTATPSLALPKVSTSAPSTAAPAPPTTTSSTGISSTGISSTSPRNTGTTTTTTKATTSAAAPTTTTQAAATTRAATTASPETQTQAATTAPATLPSATTDAVTTAAATTTTTTDPATSVPPPTGPPLQGTTTVGSAP